MYVYDIYAQVTENMFEKRIQWYLPVTRIVIFL